MRCVVPLLGLALVGCLPDELGDPPAEVLVTVEPSLATREGFDTPEGWSVRFDEVALNIGRVAFADDEECTNYTPTQYSWLIDMTVAEREKVGLAYALGDACRLGVQLPILDPDVTQLGAGASGALMDEMAFEQNVTVSGVAANGAEVISFDLDMTLYLAFGPCLDEEEDAYSYVSLSSGEQYNVALLASPELLFASVESPGVVSFDFEQADDDGDGHVDVGEWVSTLGSESGFASVVGGFPVSPLGHFIGLRDGGPCAGAAPDDFGFSPF